MTQQTINVGSAINDGTGDPARVAFDKCNRNFSDLYTADTAFLTTTVAATAYQPLDADLTAIAALGGTNTIYYRSGTSTWSAITVGTGLTFTGGTLAASGGGGGVVSQVIQKFTASGTYTPSTGMVSCIIECVGGGAGGAGILGTAGWQYSVGGGGSGGYSRKYATAADIGASKTVTIGAAGVGGVYTTTVGGAGGDTSVGSLCIAKGAPASGIYHGGAGAPATGTGDIVAGGAPGGSGGFIASASGSIPPGFGGSSYFGGGAPAQTPATSATFIAGLSATNYGSGGGGASVNNNGGGPGGGSGSAGVVIITELCVN